MSNIHLLILLENLSSRNVSYLIARLAQGADSQVDLTRQKHNLTFCDRL